MFPRIEQILCRPRITLVLCVSLLYTSGTTFAQTVKCVDSAGVLKYSSASFTDENQLANAAAAPLQNGGMLWWYGKTVTIGGNRSDSLLVFRTDATGHLVWNKTVCQSFPDHAYSWTQAGFTQILEMKNGNLLFSAAAGSTSSSGGPIPDFTLLMLDASGNRLWQNDYTGYANGALAEGLNGDILSWSAGRLTRFDANGNVLMQIQYQGGPGLSTTWPSIACIGNRIYLEGLYRQTNSGIGNERGVYLIKTDYTTGNILGSRRYRLNPSDPLADTSDPAVTNFSVVHQGKGFVFSTNIISPTASQFEVLLLSIDTMLSIVRPGLDIIKPINERLTGAVFLAAHCSTSDAAITACSFDDLLDRHLSYYTEIDEQGNCLAQRLIKFADPQYELSVFPRNGNILQQAMVSSQDQITPYFLLAENSPDLIGDAGCGGIDTSFIKMHVVLHVAGSISFIPDVLDKLTQSPVNTISSVTVIDTTLACFQKSICDSVKIHGPDTVCVGDTGVRFTVTKNAECLHYINWSMDTSLAWVQAKPDDTTLILGFRGSGRPWLTASPRGCAVQDSIQLTIRELRNVNLGGDSTLCPGDSLTLDAGSGYLSYVWQDASTDSIYSVNKAGTYSVRAVDRCDHPSADTVVIGYVDKTLSVGPTLNLCAKEDGHLAASGGFTFYTWQPSEAIKGDTTGQSVTIHTAETMNFIVTAYDKGSCPLHDTVLVEVTNCVNRLLVPSAFTPNYDGRNDLMRPIVIGELVKYEFTIYNRWGQVVFRSLNPGTGWDGRIQGNPQAADSFVWTCKYQFAGEGLTLSKGVFFLVR